MKVDNVENQEKSSSELRRINKPLVERRRRERINVCLDELKSLILDVSKKDSCRYSKLEKADILEMTVRHLKDLQRKQFNAAMTSDVTVSSRYSAGFAECAKEVTNYLKKTDGLQPETQTRLVRHLTSCVNSIHPRPATVTYTMTSANVPSATPFASLPGLTPSNLNIIQHTAASGMKLPAGVLQLVPATLPSGQMALVVPQGTTLSSTTPNYTPQAENELNQPIVYQNSNVTENRKRLGLSVQNRTVNCQRTSLKTPDVDHNGNVNMLNQNKMAAVEDKCIPEDVQTGAVWRPW